jgi:hypothetical protein
MHRPGSNPSWPGQATQTSGKGSTEHKASVSVILGLVPRIVARGLSGQCELRAAPRSILRVRPEDDGRAEFQSPSDPIAQRRVSYPAQTVT